MSEDPHVLESLPAYVLGSMDEDEARLVSEHIASCYLCSTELSSFQAVADQLALAAPDAIPPADLKRRLLERIQELTPARPQPVRQGFLQRLLPIGGLVGLLAILALIVANVLLWQRINHLEVLAGPRGMRAIALHSSDLAPEASGFVILSADGQNGVLVVDQMPPLNAGQQYQLWLMRNGYSTRGAVFSVDESGYRGVRIMAPESLLTYSAVRVTIEPAGGSAAPTGEQVLDGSLFNP
jgi:anti-sigma-K factor RskA